MFLDREVKARGAPATAATLGSVVHAVIEMVGRGELPAELASLEAKLDELWPALSFEAPWVGDRERAVAGEALARFLAWRESTDRKLVGSEARFSVSWGEEAVLSGSVDRLEVDDDGRVRIVDLKTAKSAPTAADVREDPQLATYQLACRAGGFAHLIDGPAELGGAELVFLRLGKGGPTVREQPALPGGPCYADELVDSVVRGLRTESFAARPGEYCQRCPYQVWCPGQDAGQELLQ
jgi:RecB family exonuclease